MQRIDHIVLVAADLQLAKQQFELATGCLPVDGGPHLGLGTHNALVSFDNGAYLELVAPDPAQRLENEFVQQIRQVDGMQLLHWAVASDALEECQHQLRQINLSASQILPAQRQQPNGDLLRWHLLGAGEHGLGGAMPFYIDWGDCPHPSATAPCVGRLNRFAVQLPANHPAQPLLSTVSDVVVQTGPVALELAIGAPGGEVHYQGQRPLGFNFGLLP